MITIREAVIVEGKYDKMRISALFDTAVIETGGFRVFADKEKRAVIRSLAKARGIVVLTDSDGAGFVIRNYLKGIVGADELYQAYIPEIHGKERRKDAPSKEGLLGVEGMTDEIIIDAVLKSGVHVESGGERERNVITKSDFYELGLTGREGSAHLREALLNKLGFPRYMTTGAMISALSLLYTKEQLAQMTEELKEKRRSEIMRKLKVESFDGNKVIFIDAEKKYFAIEKSEIPFTLEKGDWIEIDNEGNITHIKYNV